MAIDQTLRRTFNSFQRGVNDALRSIREAQEDLRLRQLQLEDTTGFNHTRTEEAIREARLASGKAEFVENALDRRIQRVEQNRQAIEALERRIRVLETIDLTIVELPLDSDDISG